MNDYKETMKELQKSAMEAGKAIMDSLQAMQRLCQNTDDATKVDKCNGCIYADIYDDGKFSFPICKKGTDLAEAEKMRKDKTPCELKRTYNELDEYKKEITYGDIIRKFKEETGIDDDLIDDIRPCNIDFGVPSIPNAIVVWLNDSKSKLIYIYKDKESDNE